MINQKKNWYLIIGMLMVSVTISVNHFVQLPELIHGFMMGAGIGLELVGVYSINHDLTKIRNLKRKILKRFVRNSVIGTYATTKAYRICFSICDMLVQIIKACTG